MSRGAAVKLVGKGRVWLYLLGGVTGLFLVLYVVRPVLTPFLLALLLTYLLNPVVSLVAQRGLRRPIAIFLVYLAIGALATSVVVWLIPGILREVDALAAAVPQFTRNVEQLVRRLQHDYSRVPLPDSLRTAIDDAISGAEGRLTTMLNGVLNSVVGFFPMVFNIILAPVIAFYMLCDIDRFRDGAQRVLPKEYRSQLLALGREVNDVVYGFIMGQATVAAVEGILVGLAMTALGLRFAVLIALFYGTAELVPYIGPVVGTVPALAAAALKSPLAVLQLGVAILAIQQLEAAVLAPYFVGGRLGLHPLVVIFALLLGGHFYGVTGLLLGVPAAAIIRALARFGLRMVERETGGVIDTRRPSLTKIGSWRIVKTRIAAPLARPEKQEGNNRSETGDRP